MNLHSILHIDKSFKRCYLKKKQNFIHKRYFMKKNALLLFAALLILSGCRNGKHDDLPEVKPLPGEEKVQVTLNVNIVDNADPVMEKKSAIPPEVEKKELARRKKSDPGNKVLLSPAARKKLEKKNAEKKRKKRELVPTGVGLIDSDLNSVEQAYLQQVRSRREQQVRSSEQQVFGSFSPNNIFKQPEN